MKVNTIMEVLPLGDVMPSPKAWTTAACMS
jgi:hypothetical protein